MSELSTAGDQVPALPRPDVRLLGPLQVGTAGPAPDPEAAELVVLLALHPEGLSPVEVGNALWPRRDVTAAVPAVQRVLDRVAGAQDDGGAVRLRPLPVVDTDVFRTAVREGRTAAALDLLRGPLLADRPRGRYAWLPRTQRSLPALVVDACARLASGRLLAGDPAAARTAALAGLRVVPLDERLWRALLRAEAGLADEAPGAGDRLADLARRLTTLRARQLPPYDRLQPETRELLAELRLTGRRRA